MTKENIKKQEKENNSCADKLCPIHGKLSTRGRSFKGKVIKKFPKRVVIAFERTFYVRKYERFAKRKTKLHARLSDCLSKKINVGDFVEIKECRPISKIVNFVVIKKIEKGEGK